MQILVFEHKDKYDEFYFDKFIYLKAKLANNPNQSKRRIIGNYFCLHKGNKDFYIRFNE